MVRIIFDRIVQVPNCAAGGAHQVVHGAVFEKSGFESALPQLAAVQVWGARRASPDLGDITVTTVQLSQARLGTDDMPVGIIEKTMRWHVTTDVATGST